jgi:uncharacterized repeat protein (TIGR01451 family)
MNSRTVLTLALLATVCGSAAAQVPTAPPLCPPPQRGPTPLIFARFTGPEGMQATFYQGNPQGRTHPAPVAVGLRPGYSYRICLGNLPRHPDRALYPTIQVCGTLTLPPRSTADAYPVTIALTQADIDQALAGSLVTKVFFVENTEKAVPQATTPDQLLQYDVPPERDPLQEALTLGRPVLVVRFGEKQLTPAEAAQQNVPGTILQPGDKVLPWPTQPPCVPCLQLFDPIHGPRPPEDECLHDGGDRGARAGIGADGRLHGLDPEDTVAEYTDVHGDHNVVHSNRVCLCVPRFGVARHVLPLGRYDNVMRIVDTRGILGQEQVESKTPSLLKEQSDQLKGLQSRQRPSAATITEGLGRFKEVVVLEAYELDLGMAVYLGTQQVKQLKETERTKLFKQVELARVLSRRESMAGTEQVIGTAVIGRIEGGPQVVKATAETRDLTICCEESPIVLPDRPLVLCKWADKQAAQVGDVVTFTLRYTNQGGRPITDVAVSDSLTTRLEYVPGSSVADRNAVFTTQANEAGSTILRWEITGTLQPGQSGVVRFQARIR